MSDERKSNEKKGGDILEETREKVIERLERENERLEIINEGLLAHAMEEIKAKYHRGEIDGEVIAQGESMVGWDWNLTNEEMNAAMGKRNM